MEKVRQRKTGIQFFCVILVVLTIALMPALASADTQGRGSVIVDGIEYPIFELDTIPVKEAPTVSVNATSKAMWNTALFFGMYDYPGYELDLVGPQNDVVGMAKIFDGEFDTHVYLNYSKNEMLDVIDSYAQAMGADATLLVYYSGHGAGDGSLVAADDGFISVNEMEAVLDQFEGTKVVIIDACHSGGMIGKGVEESVTLEESLTPDEFTDVWINGLTHADTANSSDPGVMNLAKGDYKVLTAASITQYSYEFEIGFQSDFAEANYYAPREDVYPLGIFTFTFHNGVGLYADEMFSTLEADADNDKVITLNEMYQYTAKNVQSVVKQVTGTSQSVKVYPSNSDFALFAKDYVYSDNGDDTVTITDYLGNDVNVAVPFIIDGMMVTGIGEGAFSGKTFIQTVQLPNMVDKIEDLAFNGCTSLTAVNLPTHLTSIGAQTFYNTALTSISLPTSLVSIGDDAFAHCLLTELEIPEGVEEIGSFAFYNNQKLTSVVIPSSLTSVGNSVFNGCLNLSSITESGVGSHYRAIDDVLYNATMTTLMQYAPKKSDTEYTIPNTVTLIESMAFGYADNLVTVNNSDQLQTIEPFAFISCGKLKHIDLPDTLLTIGEGLFANCLKLNDIQTGTSAVFERGALMDAAKTTIYFYQPLRFNATYKAPDTVRRIAGYAFLKAQYLKNVELPSGVISVGDYAFYSVSNITEIEIPETVEVIGYRAFSDNKKLKKVTIMPTATNIGQGEWDDSESNILVGSSSAVIYGVAGSYAETYANQCGLKFISVVEPIPVDGVSLSYAGPDETVQNETIEMYVEIADIPAGESAEYQLMYSTNGGKSFKAAEKVWTAYSAPEIITYTFSSVRKDTQYIFKLDARTVGSKTTRSSESVEILVCPVMPLESVTLDSVGNTNDEQVIPEGGITLTATAINKLGYEETPTYRFAYRTQGSTKWVYINKKFSEESEVQFMPKAEGTYYFKVEAMSLGRKGKVGDVWDYDYTSYTLSNTAKPVAGLLYLIADEKDYVNGETVNLNMLIMQNDTEDDVEYQLFYSTNGKSYKPFSKEYEALTIIDSEATIEVPALPAVKKDTIYYLKVQVRTVGRNEKTADAFAMTQVEFKTAHPLEDGDIQIDAGSSTQILAEGIKTLTATDESTAGYAPGEVEYRFYYKMLGGTKWIAVNRKWSTSNTIDFVLKKEGKYFFAVEARATGRSTADTFYDDPEYVGLYFAAETTGVQNVINNKSGTVREYTKDGDTLDVEMDFNIVTSVDAEFQYSYSTNGKKFIALGDWQGGGLRTTRVIDALTLDVSRLKKDTTYYLRVSAKNMDNTSADVYDDCMIKVYVSQPATEMTSFTSDATDGVKLLPEKSDTLTLTALANEDATYKFFYRLEGTSRWSPIPAKSVIENQAFFRPKKEGTYEFKAEATAVGRKTRTADVSLELSESIEIWFTKLPAESVALAIGDADNDYMIGLDDTMTLDITATGQQPGLEYQVVYS
ncbi:MAG: leucine-rich repeat protein, partial [Eubacteriales bacterium]